MPPAQLAARAATGRRLCAVVLSSACVRLPSRLATFTTPPSSRAHKPVRRNSAQLTGRRGGFAAGTPADRPAASPLASGCWVGLAHNLTPALRAGA